jgi:NAD(P)-dependent dehydrogenase (short-subunit alcohol dehydrogenase family)
MDLGLRERRVLVTAGAAGIGRVIAQRFLAEGARVAVCDIDDAALGECAAQTPGLLALCADVAVSADVGSLFARLQQKLWRSRRSGE